MTKEKEKAIDRFLATHEFRSSVASGVVDYPHLIRDPEFRDLGFNTALTLYKAGLYKCGITPIDILGNVKLIEYGISKRNGKLDFIKMVTDTFYPQPEPDSNPIDMGLVEIQRKLDSGELSPDGIIMERNVEVLI